MNTYRFNQIAMAVLGALLLFFGARTFINIAFEEHPPEKPGYEVAGTEEGAEDKKADAAGGADAEFILALQTADAGRGADVAKKCAMCHTFDAGGPNGIGPNLHGVLGRKIASHEGYDYSPALKAKAEETWDYLNIEHMVESPNTFAPGTKMALFPGLPDVKQRADLLIYLRTLTENPPPLPEAPAAAAAPEGEKTAEAGKGAAPAGGGSEILTLLATADPKKGQADVGVCKVCHSFDKGAPSPMGPPLHDVVGRKIASVEGFNYSPALKAKSGEEWTYEHIDAFIHNPQAFAPGTMMAFPGVPDAKKRAEIIAYLRSETENPPPLPEAGGAAAPAEGAAPAEAPPAAQEAPAEAAPPAAEATPAPAEDAAPEAAPSTEETAPAPAEEPTPAPAEEPAPPPAEEPAPEAAPAPAPEAPAAAPAEDAAPPATESAPPAADAGSESAPAESTITDLKAPDAPAGHKGEEPSPSQPQPVFPDGEPGAQ